jgi:hypothetical protein
MVSPNSPIVVNRKIPFTHFLRLSVPGRTDAPLPFLTHWTQINAKHVAQAAKELGAKSLVIT